MNRRQRIALVVTAVLLLVGGLAPVLLSFNTDDLELACSGVGGVPRWYLHDRSDMEALAVHAQTRFGSDTLQKWADGCDAKARQQVTTGLVNGAVVIGVGAMAVWLLGRRKADIEPDNEPVQLGSDEFPPSPPLRG